MPTYRLTVEYEGTRYRGWQEQKNARTVAGELRRALEETLARSVDLGGAGRTDAGVHALAQTAHLRCRARMEATDLLFRDQRDPPAGHQPARGRARGAGLSRPPLGRCGATSTRSRGDARRLPSAMSGGFAPVSTASGWRGRRRRPSGRHDFARLSRAAGRPGQHGSGGRAGAGRRGRRVAADPHRRLALSLEDGPPSRRHPGAGGLRAPSGGYARRAARRRTGSRRAQAGGVDGAALRPVPRAGGLCRRAAGRSAARRDSGGRAGPG